MYLLNWPVIYSITKLYWMKLKYLLLFQDYQRIVFPAQYKGFYQCKWGIKHINHNCFFSIRSNITWRGNWNFKVSKAWPSNNSKSFYPYGLLIGMLGQQKLWRKDKKSARIAVNRDKPGPLSNCVHKYDSVCYSWTWLPPNVLPLTVHLNLGHIPDTEVVPRTSIYINIKQCTPIKTL